MSRSPRRWSKVRKKWVLAHPLCPLTKRGMRTPKPVGGPADDPSVVARRISEYVARVAQPCNVWILDDSIYVLACSYAFNEAFRANHKAVLRGTLSQPTRARVYAE